MLLYVVIISHALSSSQDAGFIRVVFQRVRSPNHTAHNSLCTAIHQFASASVDSQGQQQIREGITGKGVCVCVLLSPACMGFRLLH